MRRVKGQSKHLKLRNTLALLTLSVAFFSFLGEARAKETHSGFPALTQPEPYVVMPFDNLSGSSGLSWMRVALPFVMAERAEGIAKLRPIYDPYVVARAPRHKTPIDEERIAAFAKARSATWVFSGWIRRPDWKLEVGFKLHRLRGGKAKLVAETVERGEFKDVHALVGRALVKLSGAAGLASEADDHELLKRESSKDFYAFTLFGRGLGLLQTALTKPDLEKAHKTLSRTVYIDPSLTEAQRILAIVDERVGKPLMAKARLELALKARPRYAPAIAALAKRARKKGRARRALGLYEDVLRLRPWDLESRFELGDLLWELGRSDEAFEQLSLVAGAAPKHIKARRALVLIHASRSDNASLVKELQLIATLAPKDVETKPELGAALVASSRNTEAIETYKSILELNDKNVQAHKFLGDLYKKEGQQQRAVRSYGLAIKAAPNDPRAYFLLGAMYVASGDDEAARRIYLKAQRFPKLRGEAYNNLGAIELRRNKLIQSIWYLRRAVRFKPRKAGYRYNLALSLSRNKNHAEALSEVDTALSLNPEHVESNYLKGVVELALGKAEQARLAFQKTLEFSPAHENATHNLTLLDELKRRSTEGELVVEGK
jgi:tetratricopeptide (TPR) repeat protein